MATMLDIAKRNPHAAPVAVSDAARHEAVSIEKIAELSAVAGAAPGGASLIGLTRDQLKDSLSAIGVPERELKMRVAQIWHWIYFRGAKDFAEMTNVGKDLRARLSAAYTLARPQVVSEQVSKDGTRKWLIRMASTGPLDKGAEIECVGLSRRRITVSTSGVVPQMERLGSEANTMLAISLHAVRDELRDVLVPINRKYDIGQLLDACRAYPGLSNARRITFEYVMLKGVNDSDADARELVRLLKGIPAKINLIPFNPWPGSTYECSDWERIERFSEIVFRAGYASPVRTPRGRDILAACGQLKSETEKLRARARLMLESGIGAEGMYALGDAET